MLQLKDFMPVNFLKKESWFADKKDNYSNLIARGAAMEIQKFRGSLFALPVDGFGKDICKNLHINWYKSEKYVKCTKNVTNISSWVAKITAIMVDYLI